MLYYSAVGGKVLPQTQYALNFNGTNQYLQSQTTAQGGLDFVKWDRQQPWTFFVKLKAKSVNNHAVFSWNTASGNPIGLSFMFRDGRFEVIFAAPSLLWVKSSTITSINQDTTIQIVYNGNSLASGITIIIDNTVVSNIVQSDAISGSILSNTSPSVGYWSTSFPRFFRGTINHISFVNYVKSPAELTADFNAKKQSVGSGAWLLAPIEPIYTTNGSTQIKSLATTDINNPLPNPVALTNTQGYKLNLVNYPTPLVQGIDLIQI
jgi:hypothetical protein